MQIHLLIAGFFGISYWSHSPIRPQGAQHCQFPYRILFLPNTPLVCVWEYSPKSWWFFLCLLWTTVITTSHDSLQGIAPFLCCYRAGREQSHFHSPFSVWGSPTTEKNGVQGSDLKSTGRGLTLTNHHFHLQKKLLLPVWLPSDFEILQTFLF